MKPVSKRPDFKPMTGDARTRCIYCRKPLDHADGAGDGRPAISITARDGGPRIGRAHPDCVALAAGRAPAEAEAAEAAKAAEAAEAAS